MGGAHRAASSAARRSTAHILAALFAGSAVMFAVAVMQVGAPFTGGGVAGPPSGGIATRPSPETAAAPRDGALGTAGDGEARPVMAVQSEGTGPSPMRAETHEVRSLQDMAAGRTLQWTPGATPGWETSLREALAQQAGAPAGPAPASTTQHPPAPEGVDQPDNGLVGDLLGHLGARS